jgi:hypothetical protein
VIQYRSSQAVSVNAAQPIPVPRGLIARGREDPAQPGRLLLLDLLHILRQQRSEEGDVLLA